MPTTPAILLVHGAWHGGWYWEEHFAPWLREQGHHVDCIDLPNHGGSGQQRIGFPSIRDYADAVEAAIAGHNGPVIAVGHSMGGHVVQKVMERQPENLAGAALLASVPPQGVFGVVLHLLAHHPVDLLRATVMLDLYQLVRSPQLARDLFYTADINTNTLDKYWRRAQNESFRAFVDMLALNLPHPAQVDPALPTWVAGGEKDVIFPPPAVHKTASAYGVQATIYPGMAHSSLVLEEGWQTVAADLSAWIQTVKPD